MVLPVNNYKRIFLARLAPRIIAEVKHLRNIRPPYTLKYMESLLDEGGYLNMIMDCWIRPLSMKKAINETLEFKPEVVVISIVTSDTREAIDYASDIKGINHRIIVIAVGQEPTAIPEKYIYEGSPVDFVLKGESEISLIQLLRELNNGRHFEKVRGLYSLNYRDNTIALIDDLNMLPYPRYSDRDFRKYIFFYPLRIKKKVIWGHILSSRGCPYECIFCSQVIRESYGKTIRLRTPQNIVNEIQGLISIGANIISFDDDNFTTLIEHVTGICDEIIRRNLKINWICHARIDNLTEDLLVLMKQAGCVLLRCGIESGSERILRILKKGNPACWKQEAKKVFLQAKKLNILIDALFLVGNPSETAQEIEESINLARYLSPDIIQVAFFTPYPGSSAYEEYKNNLSAEQISQLYHYKPPVVNLSQVGSKKLAQIQKKFYRSFFLYPSFIFRHIREYLFFYLHNYGVLSKLFKGILSDLF